MLSDVANSWRLMKGTESVLVVSKSNMLLRYTCVIIIIIDCKWVYSRWQCAAMQRRTIQYNTIQYSVIQRNTVQYNTIQYNKYSIIQNNTV